MILITGKTLKQIVTTLSDARAASLADNINAICPSYGINSDDILEEFLATIIHESGGFTIKAENMNYTTAQRIVDVWPSRFNLTGTGGKKNANDFTANPRKLANEVYNGRMGNRPGTDDGFNFRGSGFMQLTGRESAQLYAKYNGDAQAPEYYVNLMRTDDWHALDAACWEFAIDKKLIPAAIADDFVKVTKVINGGMVGWKDRLYWYDRVKKFL